MDTRTPQPRPFPTSRRRPRWVLVALTAAGALLACGAVVGAGYAALKAVNPVGDEWQCVDGEAPAVTREGGSACFPEGSTLPAGYRWDPFGNRPLAGNCDKDGWMAIERTSTRAGEGAVEDCVREGTDLPSDWRPVEG